MTVIEITSNPNKKQKDVTYTMVWVNAFIIFHVFYKDHNLEIDQV